MNDKSISNVGAKMFEHTLAVSLECVGMLQMAGEKRREASISATTGAACGALQAGLISLSYGFAPSVAKVLRCRASERDWQPRSLND